MSANLSTLLSRDPPRSGARPAPYRYTSMSPWLAVTKGRRQGVDGGRDRRLQRTAGQRARPQRVEYHPLRATYPAVFPSCLPASKTTFLLTESEGMEGGRNGWVEVCMDLDIRAHSRDGGRDERTV